jgi:ABC-type phosphate/phosphonate transport system permease subunit
MPRSKYRLQTWVERHPRITLAIGIAGLAGIVVWETVRVADARQTVRSGWDAGLTAGVVAVLAMISVVIVTYRLAQRARRLTWLVTVLILISPALAFLLTAPQPGPGSEAPNVVRTAGAVAGMAYAAMFFALYLALAVLALAVRVLPGGIRSPRPAPVNTDRGLLTALTGRRETPGMSRG